MNHQIIDKPHNTETGAQAIREVYVDGKLVAWTTRALLELSNQLCVDEKDKVPPFGTYPAEADHDAGPEPGRKDMDAWCIWYRRKHGCSIQAAYNAWAKVR